MKNLIKILKEAISDNVREKTLAPYRRKAKAGMTEEAAGYVGLLEILLDDLSDTTKMDDKTFKQKVERYGARSKLVSSFVKKEQMPVDKAEIEAEIEKEEPGSVDEPTSEPGSSEEPMSMKSILPDDEIDVSPSGLGGKSPGGPPPPLPKKKDKERWAVKDLPSLKNLSGKEKPATEKTPESKKKSELGLKDLPPEELGKLTSLFKQASKDLDKPLRNLKMKRIASAPMASAQKWGIGQVVKIGNNDGFLVTGGSAATGWTLSRKGKEYIFVPSATPKIDRGLYLIDDPKIRHLR